MCLTLSDFLSEKDFPVIAGSKLAHPITAADIAPINASGNAPLEEVEKATILKTMEAAGGNKSEAARRLGITRKTLHKKLKAYGVME